MAVIDEIRAELVAVADPQRAQVTRRYLQMGPEGYAAGDDALGVTVPQQRRVAGRHWRAMPLPEAATLLAEGLHEERMTALFVLVRKFRAGGENERRAVFDVVLARTAHIDNWDLVDSVAPHVVGTWLSGRDRSVLDRLAASTSVWERRMAMIATLAFIRDGDYTTTFRLADVLLQDPHDLVRKAVGWMLREVGNRDRAAEEAFLAGRYRCMPRVTLRYAVERFEPELRRRYLAGEV
jgi:3-methyladenine DNA glycosylase AlkD